MLAPVQRNAKAAASATTITITMVFRLFSAKERATPGRTPSPTPLVDLSLPPVQVSKGDKKYNVGKDIEADLGEKDDADKKRT
ncbi:hypothetical protein CSOJ01_15583 [Colletotrichum sojae]|uniref:Uncharacterized protein n=1 Tax=Colletotrichum sojae TaxID=2175907 RepID=A0A8H6IMJ0_9PEZI|nr:hypothetical protein CSOJ01_15583 [Colletotrichum sojae]